VSALAHVGVVHDTRGVEWLPAEVERLTPGDADLALHTAPSVAAGSPALVWLTGAPSAVLAARVAAASGRQLRLTFCRPDPRSRAALEARTTQTTRTR
jgi:hypothetical protein